MSDHISMFIETLNFPFLERVKRWSIVQDAKVREVVRLTLHARDGERYTVRFACDGYPDRPPRVAFVDCSGSVHALNAWPKGNSTFHQVVKLPPNAFLCTDLTREGFEHHPDWANKPTGWKGGSHTLLDLFNYIQDELLNSENYEGRAA